MNALEIGTEINKTKLVSLRLTAKKYPAAKRSRRKCKMEGMIIDVVLAKVSHYGVSLDHSNRRPNVNQHHMSE